MSTSPRTFSQVGWQSLAAPDVCSHFPPGDERAELFYLTTSWEFEIRANLDVDVRGMPFSLDRNGPATWVECFGGSFVVQHLF